MYARKPRKLYQTSIVIISRSDKRPCFTALGLKWIGPADGPWLSTLPVIVNPIQHLLPQEQHCHVHAPGWSFEAVGPMHNDQVSSAENSCWRSAAKNGIRPKACTAHASASALRQDVMALCQSSSKGWHFKHDDLVSFCSKVDVPLRLPS